MTTYTIFYTGKCTNEFQIVKDLYDSYYGSAAKCYMVEDHLSILEMLKFEPDYILKNLESGLSIKREDDVIEVIKPSVYLGAA